MSYVKTRRTTMQERRDWAFGYTLVGPVVLGFAIFAVYPIYEVFRLSLFRVEPLSNSEKFVGFENYARMLAEEDFYAVLANTGFFVGLLSTSGTILALLLALLLNQKLRGIGFFRAAIFLPALISMVAWAIVWGFILQPKGMLDGLLQAFGASPVAWLRSHWITLAVLVAVQVFKNVGLNMMILLAAMQSVPAELKDAARMDGANSWGVFRSVTLPEISPAILMVFMLMIVGSFKVFDVVYLLTRGGPGVSTSVLSYYVYSQAFERNDIGYASTLSVVLFVLVSILTTIVWQLRKRFVAYA